MLQRHKIQLTIAAGAVAVAGIAAVSVLAPSWSPRPVAASLTFDPLTRAETPADRAAQRSISVDVGVVVTSARTLGAVDGVNYLIAADKEKGVCLLAVVSSQDVRVACRSIADLPSGGLWLEFGDQQGSYLAVARPSEYRDATLETTAEVVHQDDVLVVARTAGRGQTKLVLHSDKLADLVVRKG